MSERISEADNGNNFPALRAGMMFIVYKLSFLTQNAFVNIVSNIQIEVMPDLSNANFAATSRCSFTAGSTDVSLKYSRDKTSRESSPSKGNYIQGSMDIVDTDNVIILKNIRSEIYENHAKNEVVARLLGFKVEDFSSVKVQFDEESLRIQFKTFTNSFLKENNTDGRTIFVWECRLENSVRKELCSFAIKNSRIEITLKKLDSSKKWTNLVLIERNLSSTAKHIKTAVDHQSSNDLNNNFTATPYKNGHKFGSPKESNALASQKGLCGIINIGNTCFMNAALQILLNTEKFRNYFLNEEFKKDLNVTNPLGCCGKLAKAFAYLNEQVWTSGDSFIDAAHVKEIIGTKSSQFSGFGQQDSQEFLSFLLDGLHEDLNRIVCKPTTSSPDTDGKPDFINAQMSWNAFLSRNDSIVVDLFYGQLRSHLVCPICEKISVTFDPFVFLPLSFPKPKISLTVYYWPADSDAFVRRPYRSVRQAVDSVGLALRRPILHGRLVRYVDRKVTDIYNCSDILNHKKPGQLHLFELSEAPEKTTVIPVIQKAQPFKNDIRRCSLCDSESLRLKRCVKCYSVAYCDKQCQSKHWSCGHKNTCRTISDCVIGTPFLICVPSSAKITKWQLKTLFCYGDTGLDIDIEVIFDPGRYFETAGRRSLNGRDDSIDNNCSEVEKFDIKFVGVDSQKVEMSCLVGANDDQIYLDLRKTSRIEILWKQNFIPVDELNGDANGDCCDKFVDAFEDEKGTKTLKDLLVWFSESERLQNENSWYCSTCKQHQEAEKTMQLWKLPPILIIHLKRFRYGNSLIFRNKIETPVDFPDVLNMKPYVNSQSTDSETTYDLCGVVCHSGSTFFGHYISYGRLLDEKNEEIIGWRRFDDSHVTNCSFRDVHNDSAYLLFYKRRYHVRHRC